MRALIRRCDPAAAKADPAPSRWSWRLQRLMLTPGFRFALRVGMPFSIALIAGTVYFADEARRTAIAETLAAARASIEERPEFMVKLMAIDGADDALAAEIRASLPLEFPMTSFDLDLPSLKSQVTAINGVRAAGVRVKPGGILHIQITPRIPVAIWRTAQGLNLIDKDGAQVARISTRAEHRDLPLIAGEGAARHVPEALRLIGAAAALGDRVHALMRVGERRWDVVLDRDQRILLPEQGALQALDRVIALEGAEEVLSRDVSRVDMRLGNRPTVRMTDGAIESWWQMKGLSGQ
ncbi:cell division protein FtsQ/DivIB [Sulfitobacter sp. JB4-11]|uniref:cell division protein FtsQ/DivIB n=1 Tax=Sulfitobacter rhodophyticola TaxID=3238304 RepID=UPI0035187175